MLTRFAQKGSHAALRVTGKRCLSQTTVAKVGIQDKAKQAAESVQHVAKSTGKGSDIPWAIGSFVVFAPLAVWVTSPEEKKHEVAHAVIPSNMRNYGMSREPAPVPEDEQEGDPDAAPSDSAEDSGTPESDAQFAEASEQDHATGDHKRMFQGEETLKTSRDSAPTGNMKLSDHHTDDDHEIHTKHKSEKSAATLQPKPNKLNDAADLAKSGHSHSPISGLAEHETRQSERDNADSPEPPHSGDNAKSAPTGTDTKKEEQAQ